MEVSISEFLSDLLTLQQDGQRAISGPANWLKDAVLEVRTSLHDVVDDLELSVAPVVGDDRPGRWHFFVGSPGNGKSAGAGALAKRLKARGDVIVDDVGRSLDELAANDVPYRLDVSQQGAKFPYLYIAQDASVLPDPYDPEADPAEALKALLCEAAERGVSLVVCTNRGVIERLFSRGLLDSTVNGAAWFKAVKHAVGVGGETEIDLGPRNRKRVFDRVRLGVTQLDQKSLLLNNDTFERLIVRATDDSNWSDCGDCVANKLCPFRSNRNWLADKDLRGKFVKLILHAELFDGQAVVLREALALISLILAGCPHDYIGSHPCDWVRSRAAAHDVFGLASRRLYMSMFSSYAPKGFEYARQDRKEQHFGLRELLKRAKHELPGTTTLALKAALDEEGPSTDVGVQRLLGAGKVLSALDPFAELLSAEFLDNWNESWTALQGDNLWVSPIEVACFAVWEDLQNAAASSTDIPHTTYRWLTRWITSFTLRAGALVEGVTTYSSDLDDLIGILTAKKGASTQVELLRRMEHALAQSLGAGRQGVEISPSTTLKGDWADTALKATLPLGADGITARLRFGKAKSSDSYIPLNTKAFVWLKRRAERNMHLSTFPSEYLAIARDAMLRVAVSSDYDIQDDIELTVTRPDAAPINIVKSHVGLSVTLGKNDK